MPDVTILSPSDCDELAKGLRKSADAAVKKRKSLDANSVEYAELQRQEDELRDLADQYTAVAIERDTVLPDLSASQLQAAIDSANKTLLRIGKIKAAIDVFAGLIDFAAAVISKKPIAIWESAKELKGRLEGAS